MSRKKRKIEKEVRMRREAEAKVEAQEQKKAEREAQKKKSQEEWDAKSPEEKRSTYIGCGVVALIVVVILGGCMALTGGDDDADDSDSSSSDTSVVEEAEQEKSVVEDEDAPDEVDDAPEEDSPTEDAAPGIDREMAPQEFWDERYRENNCASQNMAHQGLAMCMARGVDTEEDGTRLVLYIDQDEEGVQDRFPDDSRREMFTGAMAEVVGFAKHEGDPRVQHVEEVRVIASGGDGLFSSWNMDSEVY